MSDVSQLTKHETAKSELASFHNRLRVLFSTDYVELVAAGAIEDGDIESWTLFRKEPAKFFIRAGDETCQRIWDLIQRRHQASRSQRAPSAATNAVRSPSLLSALKACRTELAAYREAIKSLFPKFEEIGFERPSYDSRLARLDALIGQSDKAIAEAEQHR